MLYKSDCDRTSLTRYCSYPGDDERKRSKNGRWLKSVGRHHILTRLLKRVITRLVLSIHSPQVTGCASHCREHQDTSDTCVSPLRPVLRSFHIGCLIPSSIVASYFRGIQVREPSSGIQLIPSRIEGQADQGLGPILLRCGTWSGDRLDRGPGDVYYLGRHVTNSQYKVGSMATQ